MEDKSRKVRDEYFIDEALLQDLASRERKGDFFEKSSNFYNQVKDKPFSSLSAKQKNWLWELQSILHDRAQNEVQPRSYNLPVEKSNKNKNFIAKIFDKIYNIFN